MNNIIEPNDTFDFSKLSLAHPSGVQGGAYFTKIEHNGKPLYIQTSKSLTRQGFVKSGKKYYCDLMFDKNAESLIHWFENLEERCQKLIYEKRESWFQNTLEESDIESAFNSAIRVYKSGKYYLVRTNIRNTRTEEPAIKIYNESEVSLTIQDVTPETNIISILEIQGIKFTSRNFQIEIELKQVMVLDNEPLFDNCLIKSSFKKELIPSTITVIQQNKKEEQEEQPDKKEQDKEEQNKEDDVIIETNANTLANTNTGANANTEANANIEANATTGANANTEANATTRLSLDRALDLNSDLEPIPLVDLDAEELSEVTDPMHLEKDEEPITLKKPNQVYFELYKEARKKAKEAKKNAIIAYLEAKNIKKTYMIENMNDSDSDLDAEIEETSESDLDGLY